MPRRYVLGLVFVALLVAADKKEQGPNPPLTDDEKTILELTNKARAEKKLPPLTVNAILTRAARAHSANMAKKNEMNHVLDGKNPGDRVKAAGYNYATTGENIAVGENVSVPTIFENWMNSEHHRDNILREEFREIGIGIARSDDGKVYYTQTFGTLLKE